MSGDKKGGVLVRGFGFRLGQKGPKGPIMPVITIITIITPENESGLSMNLGKFNQIQVFFYWGWRVAGDRMKTAREDSRPTARRSYWELLGVIRSKLR